MEAVVDEEGRPYALQGGPELLGLGPGVQRGGHDPHPLTRQQESLARRLNVFDALVQLPFLERKQLAAVYRRAAVFVLPSDAEGLSNAALEAMASGLAIVTTRTGVASLIEGNGFVVPARDPAALRAALERYLVRPSLLPEHQRASRRLAEGMSWRAAADYTLDTYARVAARSEVRRTSSASGRMVTK